MPIITDKAINPSNKIITGVAKKFLVTMYKLLSVIQALIILFSSEIPIKNNLYCLVDCLYLHGSL